MKLLQFTHANLKTPIYVSEHMLFSFYYSESHKAVHLLASGGAIVPVIESLEQVKTLVETARQTPTEGN